MRFFSHDTSCGRKIHQNTYANNASNVRKNSDAKTNATDSTDFSTQIQQLQKWFAEHVTLFDQPYTLDYDQAKAVYDHHKNTLVTARAGSGKTRVIVAKIAYLVAIKKIRLAEIVAFMFNRTAAMEVNERITAVKIDGTSILEIDAQNSSSLSNQTALNTPIAKTLRRYESPVQVASTFHKYALDLLKLSGEQPQIIGEDEHNQLIIRATTQVLREQNYHLSPKERIETLQIVNSFIARAGQRYFGEQGLIELNRAISQYCAQHAQDSTFAQNVRLHQLAFNVYQKYLSALAYPLIDFNMLMARASELLLDGLREPKNTTISTLTNVKTKQSTSQTLNLAQRRVAPIRHILVDEYQDFSYLFFNIIQAVRRVVPQAHLFVVGDDWQAINRFAGSDVDYFINFTHYFPEDVINIPLVTNYRSDRRIVENANKYMLKWYDPKAQPATAFSRQNGKIFRCNPSKVKFDASDLSEDGLGDGMFQKVLAKVLGGEAQSYSTAAQYLKSICRIIQANRKSQIMILHRHNFTSFAGVNLSDLAEAMKIYLDRQCILSSDDFEKQVRIMTMHKSKGLESEVVILLELDRKLMLSHHPHATIFEIFGDNPASEKADQHRLLYVALTRAKKKLYLLSSDAKPLC